MQYLIMLINRFMFFW